MITFAAIDWHTFFFMFFALVACVFGLGVLFSSNVVRMAFFLVISLGATAGLFFLAGAEFVGAMQIMIYVGGTLVLLIFGVMLTAHKSFITMKTRGGDWILAAAVGGTLLLCLLAAAFLVDDWRTPRENRDEISRAEVEDTTRIGEGLVGIRTDKLDEDEQDEAAGLSGYLLPFEIVSVHLLVVLIGAGYLARTKRRTTAVSTARRDAGDTSAPRRRTRLATFVIGLVLLSNVVLSVAMLFGGSSLLDNAQQLQERLPFYEEIAGFIPMLSKAPDWWLPVGIVLCCFNVVCAAALFGWQKWGFFGLIAAVLVEAIATGASFGAMHFFTVAIAGAVLLGVLFLALRAGKPNSVWEQLE
jgi:NADH-quinone oxidoreductase subunit J